MKQPGKIRKKHGQITDALKKEAKQIGSDPNDIYNQFFRYTFLNELMSSDSGWVLKGGTNIYCRIPGARHTKDLDLYRKEHPTSSSDAATALIEAMDQHRVGPYTFSLTKTLKAKKGQKIDSEEVLVKIHHGAGRPFFRFNIDVSGDLHVVGAVETVRAITGFEVRTDFLPSEFPVLSYPIPSQIADKICAMYERHGETPPGSPSTRYRDLYDVALMARELSVSSVELDEALQTQRTVRMIHLPERVELPDPRWTSGYPKAAKNYPDDKWNLPNLDEALRVTGLLIDPILSGDATATERMWDPKTLTWVNN